MLQHQALDRVYQALSDPSRRTIVERLSHGDASVSELARPLAMSLAAVVQHVQLLEASGLIRTAKVGRVRNCSLDRAVLSQAEQWLTQRRTFWEANLDRLGDVLAARKAAGPRAKNDTNKTITTSSPTAARPTRKPR